MAKGNLQDAINYARQNPESDFARQLRGRIESGQADQEAADLGIDLSWAGRPIAPKKAQQPIAEEPKEKGVIEKAREFSIGFAKGGLETAIGTAELLQKGGQAVLAGVTPGKTYEDIKKETGIEALKGEKIKETHELLKSKTPEEKVGKVAEFAAELFWPTSKATEVAGVIDKSKKLAGASIDNLAEKASQISDDIMEGGVKVKDKIVQMASKLDDKTKTALARTSKEKFLEVVESGKKAMLDDRNLTPIEEVGQNFVKAAQSIKNRMSQIGKQKAEVLGKAKNAYQDVSHLVRESILKIQKEISTLGPDDQKYVTEIIDRLKPFMKNGKAKDVDMLIDDLQDGLYKLSDSEKAVQLTDRATGIIRNAIEGMNKKLQSEIGGSYASLNKQYSEMIKIATDVNRAVGKNGERAGAFMKQFFSPSGMTAKRLFDEMQKLTNIDFARDSRLAKFVMETLGDKRVESLLEQIPASKAEIVGKAFSWAMEKTGIKDPLKAAEKFIEQQMK